jgi:hypothetical protein
MAACKTNAMDLPETVSPKIADGINAGLPGSRHGGVPGLSLRGG